MNDGSAAASTCFCEPRGGWAGFFLRLKNMNSKFTPSRTRYPHLSEIH
jgi:hypothetical protein